MVAIASPRRFAGRLFRRQGSSSADYRLIRQIRERAEEFTSASAVDLVVASEQLRDRVTRGESLLGESVLIPAGALVLNALDQHLGIKLYDVQILAGLALARGQVTEMATGEGKTLTAVLPAFLHALRSRGVHVVTSNAYLAERDCELLAPIYESIGVSCRLLPEQGPPGPKRIAYEADITYGTGHEFGFDFLRDEISARPDAHLPLGDAFRRDLQGISPRAVPKIQRGHTFAIIDEVDHVLLDDAVSPLLLSEGSDEEAPDAEVHRQARACALHLTPDVDYLSNPASGSLYLLPEGQQVIHAQVDDSLMKLLARPWAQYVEQALRAEFLMRRDVHYVVTDEGVQIVDGSTGRIFEDRSWQDGLHQAVEAKEDVLITCEKRPLARVTRQRFYRKYETLSGMTGTATGSEWEFSQIYGLDVVPIPLRKPSQREMLPSRSFVTRDHKIDAICTTVRERYASGQPVLVGTRSIVDSIEIAEQLSTAGISHHLLNGRQDAEEADIIAQAGQTGSVTVATNLAGRGTDIKPSDEALKAGGLCVLVVERSESPRVDRQLIGRSARQGQPGQAQVFVSAEDELVRHHADWMQRSIERSADSRGESQINPDHGLTQVQKRREQFHARQRADMLAADEQRDSVIARFRGDQ